MNGTKRFLTVLGAIAALGTSAAVPASAEVMVGNDPFVAPAGRQDWHIFNANTTKCLEIENSTLDNGGQAQQWSCANIATMRWKAVPVDGIWFRLVNANSGKCLEIENSSGDNGARAQQWQCADIPTMQWFS